MHCNAGIHKILTKFYQSNQFLCNIMRVLSLVVKITRGVLELSTSHLLVLKIAWKLIKPHLNVYVKHILRIFLELNPEYKEYLGMNPNEPIEAPSKDVLDALISVIEGALKGEEAFSEAIDEIVQNHLIYREDVKKLGEVATSYISKMLRNNMKERVDEALQALFLKIASRFPDAPNRDLQSTVFNQTLFLE